MSPHIAILLTNNDDSAFAQTFADDASKVIVLLQALRPHWRFSALRVIDGVLPDGMDAFDGYVITGSPASVNDDTLPWLAPLLEFIRSADAARRPLIGLCFGHQAVARALGGEVMRHSDGWGLGLHTTTWHCPKGTHPPDWMAPPRPSMRLMAAHNEQVTRLPQGARLLSGSAFCQHGSFSIGRHILTTQYHPEMTPRFMQALLGHLQGLAARGEAISDAAVRAARESLSGIDLLQDTPLDDAQVLARWMLQFLEQAI